MNYEAIYAILAEVARNQGQLTYTDLSRRYYGATGDWLEPHGSWDVPLGQLNQMLHDVKWPALSAVVVLQAQGGGCGEVGGGFWESSPNVPARPANNWNRIELYVEILAEVHATPWPATIPIAPPPP